MAHKQTYLTHPLYHLYSAYATAGHTARAQNALARLQDALAGMGAESEAAFTLCRLRGELRADVFMAMAAGWPPAELAARFEVPEQRLLGLLASPQMTPFTRSKAEYDLAETRKALAFIRQQPH